MRLRSIRSASEYMQASDPETPVNEYLLRQLVAKRKIKTVKAGNRNYIDIDTLHDELRKAMR